MAQAITESSAAFIGGGIDDIVVLVMLFAAASSVRERLGVAAGQMAGMAIITALSLAGAAVTGLIPEKYLFLLGIIPIVLGIHEIAESISEYKKNTAAEAGSEIPAGARCPGMLSVMLLALSDGGDNLGLNIPVLCRFGTTEKLACAAVFMILSAVWCLIAAAAARIPGVSAPIKKFSFIIVPAIYLILGTAILLGPLLK